MDTIPAAGFGPASVGHRAPGGTGRSAQQESQVAAYDVSRRMRLPVRKPCKGEQTRSIDLGVSSAYYERFPTDADAAHHPLAAGPQVRLHVRYLKSPFRTPPPHTFLGIGQRLENAFRRSLDRDFLDDGIARARWIHRLSST